MTDALTRLTEASTAGRRVLVEAEDLIVVIDRLKKYDNLTLDEDVAYSKSIVDQVVSAVNAILDGRACDTPDYAPWQALRKRLVAIQRSMGMP